MKRCIGEELEAVARVMAHNAVFVSWIDACLAEELNKLPSCTIDVGKAQGRCQVLQELSKALHEAPSQTRAAQASRPRTP